MNPSSLKINGHDLNVSRLEKVLYPAARFTKGEVIDYYIKIAPVLLPHLKDRPLTLKRYPNGVDGEFFYEKRAPKYRPKWFKTAEVPSERDPSGKIDYCLVNDLASLVWVVNLADLELHPFLARKQNVERPTQMVLDLDPGAPADATDCAEAALWFRELLEKIGLQSFVKSSGSKGLHLHIPLNTPVSYETTKPFAHALALAMGRVHPDKVLHDMKRTLRKDKVFIDWSQNDSSKTTICAYSLRAKARPWVAAPLKWEEVEACRKKDDPSLLFFETEAVLKRVEKFGDLFGEMLTLKQKLSKSAVEKISALLQEKPSRPAAPAGRKKSDLHAYRAKRDFHRTKEPKGKKASARDGNLFVIQKHAASHLHYDFRLAMNGVLKSWAVPKAIPTRRGEKHLAMEIEDHPIDYARFEGIIPPGNYGGGTVMVWDIGRYRLLGGEPLAAWKKGTIHFELEGKKLRGEWSLVRMKRDRSSKQPWLLLKSGKNTRAISARKDDESALSGRTMAQIAREKKAVWRGGRKS